MSFAGDWKAKVAERHSVLCAGLDPAEAGLGRGRQGLPPHADKREWSLQYLKAVAPYCSAIKPNVQYWKGPCDSRDLEEICAAAHELGLLVIEDAKIADIGASNDAGFFYAARRADAVTFAPFAGNVGEAVDQAHGRGVGVIVLCLMSNPEYAAEKAQPVGENGMPRYRRIAEDAVAAGADGLVVGAPSASNHITAEEIETIREATGTEPIVLTPGVGAQGGTATSMWQVFQSDQVIVNAGRTLMFPDGSESSPEAQAAAARELKRRLNEERS
ncbi:MAG: orotidine 5'-phosphate decarboxylase [Spirochaetota bacterium]